MQNDERLIPIYQTTDVGRAEILRAALDGEGIEAFIDNEHQAGLSGVLQCRVLVRASDEAAAQQFVDEHEPHLKQSEE